MFPTIDLPTVNTGPFVFGVQSSGNARDVWMPDDRNDPQVQAYNGKAFETLYGGAAGGGKSDLILGLARTKHRRSLLLRRTFPDLERSLITRSMEFYGDSKAYNASKHVWNVDGRRIEFGHMEQVGSAKIPKDEGKYASAAYDFIGFDQLEQFPQYAYEFMISRARTTNKKQAVRVVATANPVGENIQWIIQRWRAWLDETYPNPARPGELRYFKRNESGQDVETSQDDPDAVSRTFIPARLSDNPYLDDDYRRQLNLLPEPLRSALLGGDFKAAIQDDAYQVIPRSWVKAAIARWKPERPENVDIVLGVDVARGGDDQTVIAKRHGDWFANLEKYPGRSTPDGNKVAGLIAKAIENGRANIDVIGVGSSAYDICKTHNLRVFGVNFAEHSDATDKSGQLRFANKRAECYWRMREALDPESGRNIALPDDPELLGDLIAPRWSMQTNGIKIEPKDGPGSIKERLGRSPDCGDAIVLALYYRPIGVGFA